MFKYRKAVLYLLVAWFGMQFGTSFGSAGGASQEGDDVSSGLLSYTGDTELSEKDFDAIRAA